MSSEAINFDGLVQVIQQTHSSFASQASKAVNISLTLRNWFIGHHIAEFELHGADRAGCGDGLLDALSRALRSRQISNTGRRQLYGYLRFYRSYPQIVRTASAQNACRRRWSPTVWRPAIRRRSCGGRWRSWGSMTVRLGYEF